MCGRCGRRFCHQGGQTLRKAVTHSSRGRSGRPCDSGAESALGVPSGTCMRRGLLVETWGMGVYSMYHVVYYESTMCIGL